MKINIKLIIGILILTLMLNINMYGNGTQELFQPSNSVYDFTFSDGLSPPNDLKNENIIDKTTIEVQSLVGLIPREFNIQNCGEGFGCPIDSVRCDAVEEEPLCPNGTLNTVTNMCESEPLQTLCPDGYTYDYEFNSCKRDIKCPGNGTFNAENDRCEMPTIFECSSPVVAASAGLDSITKDHYIKVGNSSTATTRGGRISVFDAAWNLEETKQYDTYGNINNANELRDYINNIIIGKNIALSTWDEPSKNVYNNTSLINAFKTLGVTESIIQNMESRSAYAFIGTKQETIGIKIDEKYEPRYGDSAYVNNFATGYILEEKDDGTKMCVRDIDCGIATFSSQRDRCEVSPIYNCEAGNGDYEYSRELSDQINHYCKQKESLKNCPDELNENFERGDDDRCEKEIQNEECPSDYHWDKTLDRCVKEVECPDGGTLNTAENRCELAMLKENACPAGGNWELKEDENICVVTKDNLNNYCDGNGTYYTSLQVGGQTYNVKKCLIEQTGDEYCADSGYNPDYSYNKCLAVPACTGADIGYSGGYKRCIENAINTCPSSGLSGYSYTYNSTKMLCEMTPWCDSTKGLSYNSTRNRCELSVTSSQCPSGTDSLGNYYSYSFNTTSDKCVDIPECPMSGEFVGVNTDKCRIVADDPFCPDGWTSNASNTICTKSNICPSGGTYSSTEGRCLSASELKDFCSESANYNIESDRSVCYDVYNSSLSSDVALACGNPSNAIDLKLQTSLDICSYKINTASVQCDEENGYYLSENAYDNGLMFCTKMLNSDRANSYYGDYTTKSIELNPNDNCPEICPNGFTYAKYNNSGFCLRNNNSSCSNADNNNYYFCSNNKNINTDTFSTTTVSGKSYSVINNIPLVNVLSYPTNKCVYEKKEECPNGYLPGDVDGNIEECQKEVSNDNCPTGYIYTPVSNKCVKSETVNKITSTCYAHFSAEWAYKVDETVSFVQFMKGDLVMEDDDYMCPEGGTLSYGANYWDATGCKDGATWKKIKKTNIIVTNRLESSSQFVDGNKVNDNKFYCKNGATKIAGCCYLNITGCFDSSSYKWTPIYWEDSVVGCSNNIGEVCPEGYSIDNGDGTCSRIIDEESPNCYGASFGNVSYIKDKCSIGYDIKDCEQNWTDSGTTCKSDIQCEYGTWNSLLEMCIQSRDDITGAECESDYQASGSVGGICSKTPSCQDESLGGSWDTASHRCEIGYTNPCVTGYSDSITNGKCLKDWICDDETGELSITNNYSQNKCTAPTLTDCNDKGPYATYSNGYCYTNSVPDSQQTINGTTYKDSCPEGSYNTSTNQCEADGGSDICSDISTSFDSVNNKCYKNVSCGTPDTSGNSLNTSSEKCEQDSTVSCNSSGYLADWGTSKFTTSGDKNICYQTTTPSCQGNASERVFDSSVYSGRCVEDIQGNCESGYTWDATLLKCKKIVNCEDGLFDSTNERCKVVTDCDATHYSETDNTSDVCYNKYGVPDSATTENYDACVNGNYDSANNFKMCNAGNNVCTYIDGLSIDYNEDKCTKPINCGSLDTDGSIYWNPTANECRSESTINCQGGIGYNPSSGNMESCDPNLYWCTALTYEYTYSQDSSVTENCVVNTNCSGGTYNPITNECEYVTQDSNCQTELGYTLNVDNETCRMSDVNLLTEACRNNDNVTSLDTSKDTYLDEQNDFTQQQVKENLEYSTLYNDCRSGYDELTQRNIVSNVCPTTNGYDATQETTCETLETSEGEITICEESGSANNYYYFTDLRIDSDATVKNKCEIVPICEQGTYNPVNDKCYLDDLSCPIGTVGVGGDFECIGERGERYCSPYSCNDEQQCATANCNAYPPNETEIMPTTFIPIEAGELSGEICEAMTCLPNVEYADAVTVEHLKSDPNGNYKYYTYSCPVGTNEFGQVWELAENLPTENEVPICLKDTFTNNCIDYEIINNACKRSIYSCPLNQGTGCFYNQDEFVFQCVKEGCSQENDFELCNGTKCGVVNGSPMTYCSNEGCPEVEGVYQNEGACYVDSCPPGTFENPNGEGCVVPSNGETDE